MESRSDRGTGAGHEPALATVALSLAAAGHPVLPLHTPTRNGCSCGYAGCDAAGKHPRWGCGLAHATTDPEQVVSWWDTEPEANIGLRCDGLLVVDVDGPPGERSLAQLERDLAPLPATRTQRTGRGLHLLYRTPNGTSVGNSTRPLGRPPGIDLRAGTGGYIVAAPSLHRNGDRYILLDPRPVVPLPQVWLETLALPVQEPAQAAPAVDASATSRYGRAALNSELERLLARARAPRIGQAGTRNTQLNASVFRLAQLVAGGELNQGELVHAVLGAGRWLGLDSLEVRRTVFSALKAGLLQPRCARGE